jgi:2,4-dienoyl-CoA reductase-like NADH-dependent reductase (Old Yellow Enzyme family)
MNLFSSLEIRSLKIRNRIFVSPMCQYSCTDGLANDWHLVHLGSRAVGGAGLVIAEATGVEPHGRISPGCLGLWSDKHASALKPIVKFVQSQGAKIGIQLAHAGRKGSTDLPWNGGKPLPKSHPDYWQVVGPSPIAFGDGYQVPHELSKAEIQTLTQKFVSSAELALSAGFDVIELHMAHGYLFNEFLSPLSNQRKDEYGGSLENRMRFSLETTKAVRAVWPKDKPLFVRISATDWAEGGWDEKQSVVLVTELKKLGVDLIDCSSGGSVPYQKIPVGPGYQVPFAELIKKECQILTGAVGMITEADQAQTILDKNQADAVLLAREFLRDPYWPLHAAKKLNVKIDPPPQYSRAF